MLGRLLLVVSLFAESREMVEGGTYETTNCPCGPPGPCGPGPGPGPCGLGLDGPGPDGLGSYVLGPYGPSAHGLGPHGQGPYGPGPYGAPGPTFHFVCPGTLVQSN